MPRKHTRTTSSGKPTDSECRILSALWALGPATVREVFEELNASHDMGYTTVLKFMQHAVSLEEGGKTALKNFRRLLEKVDAEQEYKSLWWQLERWERAPSKPMVVKDVPFDQTGERDDSPSSTALRSNDPSFRLPHTASPLLADNDDMYVVLTHRARSVLRP